MKRITAEDLYPMRVNPLNFTKGDAVKKIYMDNIQTPYVGLVTSVIPSTNKVEVQWPHGMGMEEPWDLIKVNPLINPPVVRQDKAYKTHQNQKAKKYNEDYCKGLGHYQVLNDYVSEQVMPLLMRSANLYNKGFSKKEAFQKLKPYSDNKNILVNVVNRVFDDNVNFKRSNLIDVQGVPKEAEVSIEGDSDKGYQVSYKLGNCLETNYFESYRKAVEVFKKYEDILVSLDNKKDYSEIVAKVANQYKESSLETKSGDLEEVKVGNAKKHVVNAKLANFDQTLDKLLTILNKES
ncbi:hypothetical protein N9948_01110 [bacterium]|nr:hypothetical protein [bacterium]